MNVCKGGPVLSAGSHRGEPGDGFEGDQDGLIEGR